jgi:hypothetical protein
MKSKLKNKQQIFVVVRVASGTGQSVVLDSFATPDACMDKCDEYTQYFKDKNIEGFLFSPQTSCFYDL